MALKAHYYTRFEHDRFYHIYNRSVEKKPMFKSERNYRFFLKQYDYYLSEVIDTYAYCLLGNHFHLLVQVKGLTDLEALHVAETQNLPQPTEFNPHEIVSRRFRKFFQSYAMAFNKEQDRVGTLFQTPFKRALVDSDQYYTQLVYYIHANPQLHGLIDDFRNWQWSSYTSIISDKPTKLKKQEVIAWFGNAERYGQFHSENQNLIDNKKFILEDD